MAKGNPSKVDVRLFESALDTFKNRNELYSECVRMHYNRTGELTLTFDNSDLQAYIDAYYWDVFNEKGERVGS